VRVRGSGQRVPVSAIGFWSGRLRGPPTRRGLRACPAVRRQDGAFDGLVPSRVDAHAIGPCLAGSGAVPSGRTHPDGPGPAGWTPDRRVVHARTPVLGRPAVRNAIRSSACGRRSAASQTPCRHGAV